MLNPTMDAAYDYDHRMAIRKEVMIDKMRQRIKERKLTLEGLEEAYPHPTGPFGVQPRRPFKFREFFKNLLP